MNNTSNRADTDGRTSGQSKSSSAFTPFPRADIDLSIPARFEQQVESYSHRVAVKVGDEEVTYHSLNQVANRIAQTLLASCGAGEAPAAFLLDRGPGEIASIVGILKAGKFYVPLDPAWPPARLAHVIADVQPQALITDAKNGATAERLARSAIPIINLDSIDSSVPAANPRLNIAPEHRAVVLYTSSSTGSAKGVLHNHRNYLHHVMKITNELQVSADDRFSLLSSCAFGASISDIFCPLLNGAAVHAFDLRAEGLAKLADWLALEQITIYHSVPSSLRGLLETLNGQRFPKLRLIRLGGAPIFGRDVELCRAHFGADCDVEVSLGSTEGFLVRRFVVDRGPPIPTGRVPVGYEVADTEVLLLDEHGETVGFNCIGEIAIKSDYLALGYWNNPDLTNQVFLDDPSGDGRRVYLTGDLGLLRPNGCLEHHGRKDLQAKVRGHRIEMEEVELALRSLASVKEAVVVASEDRPGETRLVAYLVPRFQPPPNITALRVALQATLPSFMIPSAFVMLEALPLTDTGKVDRRALPPPSTTRPTLQNSYVRPWDPTQFLLAELWEELLGIRPVGIGDSFFDLGGDSLLAVSLLVRLQEMLGRTIPQAVFMARPTIAALTRGLLEQDKTLVQPPLVKLQPDGCKTPLVFLHGDFNGGGYYCYQLAQHLGPDQPIFLLHPHGLFTPNVPATIEAMAADLTEKLVEFQPDGPYALAGHCNGALIAMEMARRLMEQGRSVGSVILIALPRLRIHNNPAGRPHALEKSPATAASFPVGQLAHHARRLRLLEIYRRVFDSYAPLPFPSRLTILCPAQAGPPDACWPRLAADLDVHMIPGGHLTSITKHVGDLAATLNACLTTPSTRLQ